MSIANVRAEIAKHFRGALAFVEVHEHGGEFSIEDIKRYALSKEPSVVIGCLGVPSIDVQGTVVVANAAFGAFCITSERNKETRSVSSMILFESVAVEIPFQTWNDSANKAPRNISGANLYSKALDSMGIAMWAARWDQQIDLQRNSAGSLDDFNTMVNVYDIGQDDNTETTSDTITLDT